MNRPKKRWKLTNMEHERKQEIFNHETNGYNQAIDEREIWLREVASIDKIQEVMEKVDSDYKSGKTSSMHMAKTISESIIGK